jgi:DNA-binding transcriptional MerR regulator
MQGFSAGLAARLSGLNYDVMDYWAKTSFIVPSIAPAAGKGSQRAYSFRDLVALRVARELRDAGLSLQALRKVVAKLKETEGIENPLAEERLIITGDDVILARNTDELVSILRRPGQLYLIAVVNLANVVEELRKALVGQLSCKVV